MHCTQTYTYAYIYGYEEISNIVIYTHTYWIKTNTKQATIVFLMAKANKSFKREARYYFLLLTLVRRKTVTFCFRYGPIKSFRIGKTIIAGDDERMGEMENLQAATDH